MDLHAAAPPARRAARVRKPTARVFLTLKFPKRLFSAPFRHNA